jgi:uncharacterized protein (TIGR03435 family)
MFTSLITKIALAASILIIDAYPTLSQALHEQATLPSYEVATVKPGDPSRPGSKTLKAYIKWAFNLPRNADLLIDAPAWVESAHYDIKGKIAEKDHDEMATMPFQKRLHREQLMGQDLLANRFGLKVHFEMRVMPAYDLVITRKVKLKESEEPNVFRGGILYLSGPNQIRLGLRNASMDEFASALSELAVDRPVINKTDLADRYDATFTFVPDGVLTPTASPKALSGDAPESIFTVLDDLGLKLKPAKESVEVVVIDHIQRPSEN